MPNYIAVVHKEADSDYGVSFPDFPGCVTAAELAAGDWNHDGWLDEADMAAFAEQHLARAGDLNCDGAVNFSDINPFVLILSDPVGWQAQYPGCPPANGDINRDGQVNFDDINPFVALLSG